MKKGELYYADLDQGIGSEQYGRRPVLIIQNNIGNMHSPTTIVAMITSRQTKKLLPTHIPIYHRYSMLPKNSIAMLEQIRTIDKTRLDTYIGRITEVEMFKVNEAIKCSFAL